MNYQKILDKYNIKANINMLLDMWNEPHRAYHNLDHLVDLTTMITNDFIKSKINEVTMEKLLLTSLFHDIVYNPSNNDNEAKSAEFFKSCCLEKENIHIKDVEQAILDTATHTSSNYLSERFNKYDMNIVERDFESLLKWEEGIAYEYSIFGELYKPNRIKFLEKMVKEYPLNSGNLTLLIEHIIKS